jgi:hypothetical protein
MEIMVQENYGVLEVYVLYLLNVMHYPYSSRSILELTAKPKLGYKCAM